MYSWRCTSITQPIKVNWNLTQIYLSSNIILNQGIQYIAEELQDNTILTDLFLSYYDLSENGGLDLWQWLPNKSKLKILGLSNWQLSSEAIRTLAPAIEENTALKELYLYITDFFAEEGMGWDLVEMKLVEIAVFWIYF